MANNKGPNIIAGAQESAEHSINKYYWVDRVPSLTAAKWKARKRLAPSSP